MFYIYFFDISWDDFFHLHTKASNLPVPPRGSLRFWPRYFPPGLTSLRFGGSQESAMIGGGSGSKNVVLVLVLPLPLPFLLLLHFCSKHQDRILYVS